MKYQYKSLSVPGGGFVTGFLFHPMTPNILYCRTDIGGVYRYDFNEKKWISLVDQIKDVEKWKTYPLSIAIDKQHEEKLYMSVGEKTNSAIGYSANFGETFTYLETPISKRGGKVEIHGNAPGRSTGERLIVDPYNSDVLYLGTMGDGFFITTDQCKSWDRKKVGMFDEQNIVCVVIDERAGAENGRAKRIIVATSGEYGSPDGITRGKSVYISQDGGQLFKELSIHPAPISGGCCDHPGYVAQHITYDLLYLYITYSAYNIGWTNWNMYGCDTGKCYDGAIYRYQLDDKGKVMEALDITPLHPMQPNYRDEVVRERRIGYGLSGISTDPNIPGVVMLTTINAKPDVVYRSLDYGKTFIPIMAGLKIGELKFDVSYQKPVYNGKDSLIHWMSDIQVNPFDSDMVIFNSGVGVFSTSNLRAMEHGEKVIFKTLDSGIEETVHLNVYAPSMGDVKVIDVIGDLGMFCFKDVYSIPQNTVADKNNNRWITAMNADFSDISGTVIIATMRGNWTGMTKGGLVIRIDKGGKFEKLPDPNSINNEIDKAIVSLKAPNVTSGWIALSANEKHFVWSIGLPLNGDLVVYSHNYGKKYKKTEFYDYAGKKIVFHRRPVKVFSDRMKENRFFAFADYLEGPQFFASDNFGESFQQIHGPKDFPNQLLAGIDEEQKIEIRGIPKEEGAFFLACNEDGLWKIKYSLEKKCFLGKQVSNKGDVIKRIGIGVGYTGKLDMLYTSGTINKQYGFYRSEDGGKKWNRINDEKHQFGDIRSIDGDKKIVGRFYVATGTRGLLFGEPR